jgi:hypothetical protein
MLSIMGEDHFGPPALLAWTGSRAGGHWILEVVLKDLVVYTGHWIQKTNTYYFLDFRLLDNGLGLGFRDIPVFQWIWTLISTIWFLLRI